MVRNAGAGWPLDLMLARNSQKYIARLLIRGSLFFDGGTPHTQCDQRVSCSAMTPGDELLRSP